MTKLVGYDYDSVKKLFKNGKKTRVIGNNTSATRDMVGDNILIKLHGYHILTLHSNGDISFTDAGWPTKTTANRLEAFLPGIVKVKQDDYISYKIAGNLFVLENNTWYKYVDSEMMVYPITRQVS